MMRQTLALILSAVIGLSLLSACSNVGCTENRNSVPLAGFYSMATKKAVSIDSLEVGGIGAPGDSLLLTPGFTVEQLYLPFRSTMSSTSFYFRYLSKKYGTQGLADTLRFEYTSHPYFASEDCGAMYHYQITDFSYTTHLIDSVAVIDSLITNIDRQSIQIYFRVADGSNPILP